MSVIDLDDHLADRRTSYYDGFGRASRASTTKRYNVHSSSGQRPNPKFLICQRMIMMTHLSVIVMKFISVSINRWFPMSLVHLMMYLIRLNYQMVNQLNLPLMNWLTARLQVVIETKDKTFSTRPRNVDSSFKWILSRLNQCLKFVVTIQVVMMIVFHHHRQLTR